MQRISCFIHLGIFWAGVMSAIVLVPGDQVVTVSVGGSTTLRCTMEGGTISNYYTNWYRKTQGDILTFIYGEGSGYGSNFQDRFQAKTDNSNNQAVLKILKASMSDEGFYYCAIDGFFRGRRPIAHTDKLIFGKGTRVTVEPKIQPNTRPSVFVMKNGTKVACLVKDFYPKTININLNSLKKITEFDPAIVVTPSGKYSAVKLGQYEDSDSVTCSVQHNNEILNSTNPELKESHSEPTKPGNEEQTSESCHEPKVHAWKMNMMSLTLLGLRVVLAKSIAINVLLTAKLFFF